MARIPPLCSSKSASEQENRLFFERPIYDLATSVYQRILALLGLVILSPLLILIAIAVKLTSSGPILYRGQRVGKGKSIYTMYKFRTMKLGSEQKIGKRLVQPSEITHYTRIGPLLRKYRLDELPQLINVLKGEMALVGPRPLRPIFLEEFCSGIPNYERRFDVRPGITGLAQVRGGYYTSPRHKLAYDLLYLKKRTLLLDLRLIFLTFLRVMTRVISVGLAIGWLLLAGFALPEEQLNLLTIRPKELSINLLYLILPFVVVLKAVSATLTRKRLVILKTPVDLFCIALIAVMLISSILSITPILAVRGTFWYLCNAIIPFYLCLNSAQLRHEPLNLVRGFGWLGGIIATLALSESLLHLHHGWVRPGGGLEDPLWLSLGLSLLLPLAWRAGHKTPSKDKIDLLSSLWSESLSQKCSQVSVILIIITLLLAGSRVVLATAMIFALFSKIRRLILVVMLMATGSILFMSYHGDQRFTPSELSTTLQNHLERQKQLLEEIPNTRFIIGIGPRVSSHYLTTRYKQREKNALTPLQSPAPHKAPHLSGLILTSIVELGLIGSMLLFTIIIRSLSRILYEAKERNDLTLKAIGISIISALLIGIICHPFALFPLSLLFWSLLGFGLGVALETRSGPKRVYQLIRASAPL